MTCSFSNSSTAVNVTATVLNSSVAVCTSPAWTVDLKRASEAVSLSATSGGCMIESPFEFYTEPQVTGVHPLRGPRYGSFLLQVNLGASLDDLAMVERVSPPPVSPTIRVGAWAKGRGGSVRAGWHLAGHPDRGCRRERERPPAARQPDGGQVQPHDRDPH